MSDARVLKATFVIVFILGVTCSIFVTLFLSYFKSSHSNTKVRVFSPIPYENNMEIQFENSGHSKEILELSVRKADLEQSGK